MTTNFLNYILLAVGILTIMVVLIIIFLDKLKGDDLYFNIDVKEQELKRLIENAEEVLSELNFTSDVIVKDIGEQVNNLNLIYKGVNNNVEQHSFKAKSVEQPVPHKLVEQRPSQMVYEKKAEAVKYKTMTIPPMSRNTHKEEIQKSKQEVIYDLASQGISISNIAKQLNIGQGEVSLILSLKKEEN